MSVVGNAILISRAFTVLEQKIDGDVEPFLALDNYLGFISDQLIGSVSPRQLQGERVTKAQVDLFAAREEESKGSKISRFLEQFVVMMGTMQRRLLDPDTLEDDAKALQKLLLEKGLTNKSEIRNPKSEIDFPGWEWRYLWQHCQSDALYTLCQKSNAIYSLAVSHDGKWLAAGEFDEGGLSLWDLERRREITQVPAGIGLVVLALSPPEPLLAFTSYSAVGAGIWKGYLGLWDGATRQVVRELDRDVSCWGFAFSEDGQRLHTFTRKQNPSSPAIHEGFLTLWRAHDGQRRRSHGA